MTPSEQARADAMADAETLLEYAGHEDESFKAWLPLSSAQEDGELVPYFTEKGFDDFAVRAGIRAARAAFRAVPALRGDR